MTDDYNGNRGIGFDRRSFLRSATGAGVTLGGFAVASGVASADSGHLNDVCSGTLPLSGLTWGDPVVTYRLRLSGGITEAMEDGVRDAIDTWQHLIREHADTGLTDFVEASGGERPDVTIQVKRSGGLIAGQELTLNPSHDDTADRSMVQVSGSFGPGNVDPYEYTFSVALHELGHSFQLGHYDGDDGDEIMGPEIQDPPITHLSTCDLAGFETAHENLPDGPSVSSVSCSNSC